MYNASMNLYNTPPVYFNIVFTDRVVFKDQTGQVTKVYEVGDVIKASHDTGIYFVTPMGGIYHTEARIVNALEQVTYAHANDADGLTRFMQYSKDPLPAWAVDIRIEGAAK